MKTIDREILMMLGYGSQSSGFRSIQEKPRPLKPKRWQILSSTGSLKNHD